MSQNTYLNILKYGCYAALLVIFFVFKNLLFPFITSKQISFNILIEVLFIIWLAFIIKYPEYRPKKHYVWFGLLGFLAAMAISSFTGVDFNLSFWGDIERMLGVFHILHFLAFYFIIITVMRDWKDWKIFLIVSTVFAVFVSLDAQSTPTARYGTIGNTAYVSGYLLFNMYFSLLLFFKEDHKGLRWLYLIPLLLMFPGFVAAKTSGAWVGLGASVVAVCFLYGILHKNRKVKIATLAGFVIITSFIVYVFILQRDNFLTRHSAFINRTVQDININKRTFQTRLVSWRAALKDFPHLWLLGTGFGNFAITFDKYFDPSFYNFARGETYFDRAHNNVIDIASTTGALGLLMYLSIFGALGYYLVKGYRNGRISLHEFVLVSGLITAYFVQNLAVFDSLVTYMALMITLGFVYWLTEHDENFERPADQPLVNKEIYSFAIVGVIVLTVMYQFNIKPLKMLIATIDGQRAWAQGDVAGTYENYRRALGYNTVLDRDSRTSMNRLFVGNPASLSKLDRAKAQEIIDFNIQEAKANVDYNPRDSLNEMMYAQMLDLAANFNRDNQDRYFFYSDQALAAIDASIAATPGRTPVYFQKAQIQINRGDEEGAIGTLTYAASLNPEYEPAYCYLARTLQYYKRDAEAWQAMDQCLTINNGAGASDLTPASYIKSVINHYVETEDWDKVLVLYEALANNIEPKNADNWIKLAKLYGQLGDKEKARTAAEKVIALDPTMGQYAQEFIDSLGN